MAEDLKANIIKLALEGDLKQSLKLAGNDVKLLRDIGIHFYKLKKLEVALIFVEKILEIDPKNAAAHHNRGVLLSYLERYEEAEKEFREAIRLKPEYAIAHHSLGNLLRELERYEEAEEEYRKAIKLRPDDARKLGPDDARVHDNLGVLLSYLERYEEAEEEYRKAIKLRPDDARVHNNFGVLLHEQGYCEEAEEELREAIELEPDYADAHDNLGILLIDLGDITSDEVFYEEAIEEFKKALDLGLEEDAEVHNSLGCAYGKLDYSNKAREEFIKALKLDPSYYKARRNLKRTDETTREKVPTWLKVILGLIIVGQLGFSYYIFLSTDKLSGSNFVTMTLVLTAFLLFLVVYPELRKFKAGPFEFEMDGKGKTTKTPSEIDPLEM